MRLAEQKTRGLQGQLQTHLKHVGSALSQSQRCEQVHACALATLYVLERLCVSKRLEPVCAAVCV